MMTIEDARDDAVVKAMLAFVERANGPVLLSPAQLRARLVDEGLLPDAIEGIPFHASHFSGAMRRVAGELRRRGIHAAQLGIGGGWVKSASGQVKLNSFNVRASKNAVTQVVDPDAEPAKKPARGKQAA